MYRFRLQYCNYVTQKHRKVIGLVSRKPAFDARETRDGAIIITPLLLLLHTFAAPD